MVVDIETVVDVECPPPPSKDETKPDFAGPAHWRVVSVGIGWCVDGHARKIACLPSHGMGNMREEMLLRDFVRLFEGRDIRVVGWNTRGFDLPVIAHRCMGYGIQWPWYYSERRGSSPRYRYSAECNLDLMDYLCDHGSSRKQSMDSVARLIGLSGKGDVSGGDVAAMWGRGELAEIDKYCGDDVAQTVAIFNRFELLRGKIGIDEYVSRMESWLTLVGGEKSGLVRDIQRLLAVSHVEVGL